MCDIGTNYIKTIKATTLFVVFLFVHSWEQRKLGDLVKEVTRRDPNSNAPIMMITANNGFIEQSERYAFNNAGESLKKYILLQKGELAYNHGASKLRPYGSCFALATAENARIPFVYHCFSAERMNPEFLSIELNGNEIESQLRSIVSSGARMDGLLNISFGEYTSVSILFPKKNEQDKIADFFRQLDNLITLHQRKDFSRFSQILRRKKHSFLPISWEQRKLGDTTQIIMGQSPDGSTYSDFPTDYILVQGNADLENGWVKPRIWTTQKTKYAVAGDLIMSVRAPAGSMGKTAYNVVLGRGVAAIKGNEFIFQVLTKMDLEGFWKKLSAGSTFESLNSDNIINANINLPSNLEQDKIGSIFENIDNLITLHHRECFYIYKKYLLFLEMQNSHKRNYSWEQRKLGDYFIERNERSGNGEMISVTINSGIRKFDELNRHDTKPDDLSKYKRVEIGDIAYNSMRMWQGASGYSPYSGILSPAYTVITPKEGVSSRFFAYLIKRPKTIHLFEINSQGLTKDTWNLKFPAFAPIEVKAPVSYEEQVNISRILIQLDNLITLHQCESCKKVGAVQSAFARRNLLKWADSWEQRKLGDTTQIIMGQSPDGSTYSDFPTDYILVQGNADLENGWVKPRIWTTQKTKYAVAGDLIMSVRAPAGSMGKTAYNVVLGRGVAAIKGNEFIFQVLTKMDLEGFWKKLSAGSTFESLNSDNIINANINLPSNLEQDKIGSFFENIDNLITLHQRKYDKLVAMKKALLEKMFPADGETVPKIRFKGFSDAWEQRKLGEMGQTYTGLSGKTKDDFGHGQARFVTYMNVFSNPISNPEMTEPIEIDPKQNEVEVGDVFFTTSSETPEEVGMSSILLEKRGKTYLNSFCFGFRPSEKIDSYYLAYMLRSESARAKITLLAQGISRYNISKNKVMEIAVSLPSLDEQKMIGQYFSQLDNLITLHQRNAKKERYCP